MRYLVLFISALLFQNAFAQTKRYDNWHFGFNAWMSFSTTPVSTFSSSINTLEGCSSISDTLGQTLFYTDGVTVYDKSGQIMPNGTGLGGNFSSTQSALIVPIPGKVDKYIIFTTGGYGYSPCECLQYSLVDMSLNGGLGDITSKNNLLDNVSTERLAGALHSDSSSVWVIAHEYTNNHFFSYLVDTAGLHPAPIISSAGISNTPPSGVSMAPCAEGQMKVSPDGTKIAYCLPSFQLVEILDFDNTTGLISNPITIKHNHIYPYGLEFSPDSKLLYVTNDISPTYIIQYSLLVQDSIHIASSAYQVANSPFLFGQLQLAPDKKIYAALDGNNGALQVIAQPDNAGSACQFIPQYVVFPGETPWHTGLGSQLGLPNYIAGYFKTAYVPPGPEPEPPKTCEASQLQVPNVISPNADGINDEFKVNCEGSRFIPEDLIIYNRWGKVVYDSQKYNISFSLLDDGTYFYVFSYKSVTYRGFLTVLH